MSSITEYQEEYCGMGGSGSSGGLGKPPKKNEIVECSKSYDVQPVGGRAQARHREAVRAQRRLPVYDTSYFASVNSKGERGTHRAQPQWRDPRWSEPTRASNSTLYEPSERDPPNRNDFYVYRTTAVDAANTPCQPLAAPDVHKLRYMSTEYMNPDDWY